MARHSLRRRYGRARGGLHGPPAPGTRVRLTGSFLKSTGQQRGREGSKVFTVIGTSGDFVQVNEPLDEEFRKKMWGDLPESERPRWRTINRANLEVVGSRPQVAYP